METKEFTLTAWPPAYTLKKMPRARHVKLKASLRHGLELVVPMRFNQKNIPEILETNKAWIEKQLAKLQEQMQAANLTVLPTEINLQALNQLWHIHYIQSDNKKLKLVLRPQQEIVLLGDIQDKKTCYKLLAKWIKEQAKQYLLSRLQTISLQTQLSYQSAAIRGQRSRWGSCSTAKVISLNYKLIFLPTSMVDHILIHELCHTIHMNHSTKFWRLVATFDPDWREYSKTVKRAEQLVPVWVEKDF